MRDNPYISIHAPLTGSDKKKRSPGTQVMYFNPRSPYGERRPDAQTTMLENVISIHAPLTGSDLGQFLYQCPGVFQSTLPLRGATRVSGRRDFRMPNFNPRSPYGERLDHVVNLFDGIDFNPRSPYGERLGINAGSVPCGRFQSTLPLRGATDQDDKRNPKVSISIHAPLTGSDLSCLFHQPTPNQFQSTLPLRGATITPFI